MCLLYKEAEAPAAKGAPLHNQDVEEPLSMDRVCTYVEGSDKVFVMLDDAVVESLSVEGTWLPACTHMEEPVCVSQNF